MLRSRKVGIGYEQEEEPRKSKFFIAQEKIQSRTLRDMKQMLRDRKKEERQKRMRWLFDGLHKMGKNMNKANANQSNIAKKMPNLWS